MRWREMQPSQNVEDRRGMRRGRRAEWAFGPAGWGLAVCSS